MVRYKTRRALNLLPRVDKFTTDAPKTSGICTAYTDHSQSHTHKHTSTPEVRPARAGRFGFYLPRRGRHVLSGDRPQRMEESRLTSASLAREDGASSWYLLSQLAQQQQRRRRQKQPEQQERLQQQRRLSASRSFVQQKTSVRRLQHRSAPVLVNDPQHVRALAARSKASIHAFAVPDAAARTTSQATLAPSAARLQLVRPQFHRASPLPTQISFPFGSRASSSIPSPQVSVCATPVNDNARKQEKGACYTATAATREFTTAPMAHGSSRAASPEVPSLPSALIDALTSTASASVAVPADLDAVVGDESQQDTGRFSPIQIRHAPRLVHASQPMRASSSSVMSDLGSMSVVSIAPFSEDAQLSSRAQLHGETGSSKAPKHSMWGELITSPADMLTASTAEDVDGMPPPKGLLLAATERMLQIGLIEEERRQEIAVASAKIANQVGLAAAERLEELERQRSAAQELMEAEAEAANKAAMREQPSLVCLEIDGEPPPDVRLHADQQGWRDHQEEEASRGQTYREWVSTHTARSGFDLIPDEAKPDVVQGLWTCCEALDPDAEGCLQTNHSNEMLHCVQCGRWVRSEHWSGEQCWHHIDEPVQKRWGALRWQCCGKDGLQNSKYAKPGDLDQTVDVPHYGVQLHHGFRNEKLDATMGGQRTARRSDPIGMRWARLLKQKRATDREVFSRNGCRLSRHMHNFKPTCSHCDMPLIPTDPVPLTGRGARASVLGVRHSGVPDGRCANCGTDHLICTQCHTVVRVPDGFTKPCKFHPGVWCPARKTRMALKQTKRQVTPPSTVIPTPMPPPASPPRSPIPEEPTAPPPSEFVPSPRSRPRRWASSGMQTLPVRVKPSQPISTQTEGTRTIGVQMGYPVHASVQTDSLEPAWCRYTTNLGDDHRSHSVIIRKWESLPRDFVLPNDRFSADRFANGSYAVANRVSGPSPLRELLDAARLRQARLRTLGAQMVDGLMGRTLRDSFRTWMANAMYRRAILETLLPVCFRVLHASRWRNPLAPPPPVSDLETLVKGMGGRSITSLSQRKTIRVIEQAAMLRAFNRWIGQACSDSTKVQHQLAWIGKRIYHGVIHEAWVRWVSVCSAEAAQEDHGQALHSEASSVAISVDAMEAEVITEAYGSTTTSASNFTRSPSGRQAGASSNPEHDELVAEVQAIVAAARQHSADPNPRSFGDQSTAVQTMKAWEWVPAGQIAPGIYWPPEMCDSGTQTVNFNKFVELSSIGIFRSNANTQATFDPGPMVSVQVQTDYLEAYGKLNLTRRAGRAAENKVRLYAATSVDSTVRDAVAAANARVAERRAKERWRQSMNERKVALQSAAKEKIHLTWSYSQDDPHIDENARSAKLHLTKSKPPFERQKTSAQISWQKSSSTQGVPQAGIRPSSSAPNMLSSRSRLGANKHAASSSRLHPLQRSSDTAMRPASSPVARMADIPPPVVLTSTEDADGLAQLQTIAAVAAAISADLERVSGIADNDNRGRTGST